MFFGHYFLDKLNTCLMLSRKCLGKFGTIFDAFGLYFLGEIQHMFNDS